MIVRKASQIYTFIGDCHVPRFEGLALQSPDDPDELTVARIAWRPHLRASDTFENGRVNEFITGALVEGRAVRNAGTDAATHFAPLPVKKLGSVDMVSYIVREGAQRHVLILSYGEVDIWDIAQYHIAEGLEDVNEPFASELVRAHCAPLFATLAALKDAGFPSVFLHDIPPPPQIRPEAWPPPRVRRGLIVLFNRAFRAFCEESGIGLVSTHDDLLSGEWRAPEFDKDGLHTNADRAALSMLRIYALLHP